MRLIGTSAPVPCLPCRRCAWKVQRDQSSTTCYDLIFWAGTLHAVTIHAFHVQRDHKVRAGLCSSGCPGFRRQCRFVTKESSLPRQGSRNTRHQQQNHNVEIQKMHTHANWSIHRRRRENPIVRTSSFSSHLMPRGDFLRQRVAITLSGQ